LEDLLRSHTNQTRPVGNGLRQALTLILAILLVGISGLIGCADDNTKPLEKTTVAVYNWPGSAALYVAADKGYFRDAGLEVALIPYSTGKLALDAVLGGQADFATVADTPIANAAVNSKPFAVIATICETDNAVLIIARKDLGISSPLDLKGKKVGQVAGGGAQYFLSVYLTTFLIDPKDVQIVNLDPDKVIDALLNGDVDAVSTFSPNTIILRERLGSNAVVLSDPRIFMPTWNLAVTQDFARKNPEMIRKFLSAIFQANTFIAAHPAEVHSISAKYIGLDSALFEKEWGDFHFTAMLDQSLILSLEDQARWIINGGPDGIPNFLNYIYADGLKTLKANAVTIPGK
jgi:ABC-type nitrate/sulfonate/bicarbonate transport system substrate-binding protein